LVSERKLRILTFLRHEPSMYELAKTGQEFDFMLVDRTLWTTPSGLRSRPTPSNVGIEGKAENITSPGRRTRFSLSFAGAMTACSSVRLPPSGWSNRAGAFWR
jgi:hypothetical protein